MIYYFGYGANRERARIREVLGKEPQGGYGAVLEGFDLGYQILDQIPQKPQEVLRNAWGDRFKCYTLRRGKGLAVGVIWEMDQADLEIMKKWEFIGLWREIVQLSVKTFSGETIKAITEKAIDDKRVFGFVDGLNYENNLNLDGIKTKLAMRDEEYRKEEIAKIRTQIAAMKMERLPKGA